MTQQKPIISAASICDVLGRKAMAARLKVKLPAISNASVEGRFPAKWFPMVRAMCVEAGIECPESLFNFIEPDAPTPSQEDAA